MTRYDEDTQTVFWFGILLKIAAAIAIPGFFLAVCMNIGR